MTNGMKINPARMSQETSCATSIPCSHPVSEHPTKVMVERIDYIQCGSNVKVLSEFYINIQEIKRGFGAAPSKLSQISPHKPSKDKSQPQGWPNILGWATGVEPATT
jgi:hypothetical protein